MEEEIKGRIALGNKVYFANKKMFQSRLISKRAKLKLYYSVIRPTVTYSCETWILKETIINKLLVFEGPPLWSSGQSFWLQIQRSRVRFPALPDFLSSSGSGTGSTQPREIN